MPRSSDPAATLRRRKRARLTEMRDAGMSVQAIAREFGVHASTVSRWAKADGVSFDRSQTRAAVEARKVDLAAMRAELATLALQKARGFLDALDRPFLVFNFGGKDNTYAEQELDRPPTGDIRNLMTSYGIAVQRSMELSKFDADPNEGGAAVDAWLAHMIGEDTP